MMLRLAFPVLFLTVTLIPAPAQPSQPKKYALLIGINRYNHADLNKPSPLQFAEKDIADTKALFEANGYEVDVLLGEKATLKAIRDAIKKAAGKGNAEGVVVIGLAGHGTQPEGDQEAYFCPFDAGMRVVTKNGKVTTEFDTDTLLPLAEVLANLKASPAGSRVLLADCCRNDPASGRGRGVGAGMKVSDLPENTAVMLACSRGQRAYEDKSWGGGHGAFFYHVLKGMEKDAVDDKGRVLADRLKVYLEDSIPEEVGKVIKGGADQKPFCLVSGRVDLQVTTNDPRPGHERDFEIADGVKMRFCWIPRGSAQLGSPEEEQAYVTKAFFKGMRKGFLDEEKEENRRTYRNRGFWLGKYEVTQEQWETVMKWNLSEFAATGTDPKLRERVKDLDTTRSPVEMVSWTDIQEFLNPLNTRPGSRQVFGKSGKFVLPHEDEWEFACRGGLGNKQPFYFGSELNGTQANCNGNYPYGTSMKGPWLERPQSVGSYEEKARHPWGLCDMHGNVWEWCENKHGDSDTFRVYRGGGWDFYSDGCRAAYRNGYAIGARNNRIGFRVCYRLD